MQIPDTAIRSALITAFTGLLDIPAYDTAVPKDVEPLPNLYVIFGTQDNRQHSTNKCNHLWAHVCMLDIVSQQPQGYASKKIVEDILNQIQTVVDLPGTADLDIPGFSVYNTQVLSTTDMSLNTPTQTIVRKIVRYQWILGVSA